MKNNYMLINNELRDRAYKCACDHGFHDRKYPIEHWLTLIVTEIAEAVNADRKEKHSDIIHFKKMEENELIHWELAFEKCIKDSVEDELADVIIRCLDYAGMKYINIILPNLDKAPQDLLYDSITVFSYYLISHIYNYDIEYEEKIIFIITDICLYCRKNNIDILWHIEKKMRYNEMRPMLNGKKY